MDPISDLINLEKKLNEEMPGIEHTIACIVILAYHSANEAVSASSNLKNTKILERHCFLRIL